MKCQRLSNGKASLLIKRGDHGSKKKTVDIMYTDEGPSSVAGDAAVVHDILAIFAPRRLPM